MKKLRDNLLFVNGEVKSGKRLILLYELNVLLRGLRKGLYENK